MERIRELDGVRGLAAVLILLYHLRPGGAVFMGWAAVDVFFVLSGYLITSIILKHLGSRGFLLAFYVRRGLRIWPPYALAIAALVMLDAVLGDRIPLNYLPSFLTFTQGLPWLGGSSSEFPAYFGHTWTLAIEEQFYLLWPALLVIFGRRSTWPLAAMFLTMSVAMRSLGVSPFVLVSRCDGFAVGAVVASILSQGPLPAHHERRWRSAFTISALLSFGFAFVNIAGQRIGLAKVPGSTLLALNSLFASVIGLFVLHRGAWCLGWLRSRPLVYLGQISYGLYLYHALVYFVVFVIARRWGFAPSIGRDVVAMGLTLGVAALSWRFLERPLLTLKDQFPYQSQPRATAPRPEFRASPEIPAGV